MKKWMFFLGLFCALSLSVPVQARILWGENNVGGFGGPFMKFTTIHQHNGFLMGGGGGFIIGHQFIIGGAGYGLVTDIFPDNEIYGDNLLVDFGYGGVLVQMTGDTRQRMFIEMTMLLGGGNASYHLENSSNTIDSGGFFVFEPGAHLTYRITNFLQLGVGVTYRMTEGFKVMSYDDHDLSGAAGSLQIRFGTF